MLPHAADKPARLVSLSQDAAQLMAAPTQDRDTFLTAIFHTLATEAPIKDKVPWRGAS